jgi:hypothetical protein
MPGKDSLDEESAQIEPSSTQYGGNTGKEDSSYSPYAYSRNYGK